MATQQYVVLPGLAPTPSGHAKGFHPNSRAALMRYRRSWADQRKCAKCNSPAIKGRLYCVKHNGQMGALHPSPARLDARWLERLYLIGLLPMDLAATPLWQALNGLGMATRAPLQRALVLLWDRRESDPQALAQVWRHALRVVRNHGGAR